MKYINELREGENIIEHYLCKSRQTMKLSVFEITG